MINISNIYYHSAKYDLTIRKTIPYYYKYILWFILLFPQIRIGYLMTFSMYDSIIDIMRITSISIVFLLYIQKRDFTALDIWLLVLVALQTVSSLINNITFYDNARNVFSQIVYVLLIGLMIKDDKKVALNTIMFIFELLLYMNLFTIIAYPKGLYYNQTRTLGMTRYAWFLGNDGLHIDYFIIGFYIALLRMELDPSRINKARSYSLMAACIISAFYGWMSTALVALAVMLLAVALRTRIRIVKVISMKTALLGGIIASIGLVFFNVQFYFSYLFINILKRDLTLSSRTNIWRQVIIYIRQHLFFGNGFGESDKLQQAVGSIHAATAHNQLLQFLFNGGIIYFIAIMTFFIYLAVRTDKKKDALSFYSAITLACILIVGLTRQPFSDAHKIVWIFVPIVYNLDALRGRKTKYAAQMYGVRRV